MEFNYKDYFVRIVQNPTDLIVRFEKHRVWERTFTERDFVELQVLGGLEFIGNLLTAVLKADETKLLKAKDITEGPKNLSFDLVYFPEHISPITINICLQAVKLQTANVETELLARQLRELKTSVKELTDLTITLKKQLQEQIEKSQGYVMIAGSPNPINDKIISLDANSLPSHNLITSLANLKYLTECTSLFLQGIHVEDFSAIGNMTKLQTLIINSAPKLKDISWIKNLKQLHTANFNSCQNLIDISPLTKIPNLKTVHVNNTGVKNALFLGPGIQINR